MKRKFPQLQNDGSFSFDAFYTFNHSQSLTPEQLNCWICGWIKENDPWTREWSSGRTEKLEFDEEFQSIPRVESTDEVGFNLRIEGKENARYWKDWFVKLSRDLIDEFPEIHELKMQN